MVNVQKEGDYFVVTGGVDGLKPVRTMDEAHAHEVAAARVRVMIKRANRRLGFGVFPVD